MMSNYFKPLRRKVGVVTLGLACLLVAGWARNYSVRESINFPIGDSSALQFHSGDHCMSLVAMWTSIPDKEMASVRFYRHDDKDGVRLHVGEVMLASGPSPFRPKWFRFGLGNRLTTLMTYSLPYWSMVVPLTLLSACLLLSKPRPVKSTGYSSPRKEPLFTSSYPWTIEYEGVTYTVITGKDFALMDVARGKLLPWKPRVLQALEKHAAGTSMRMSADNSKSTQYDTFYEIDEYCIRIDSNSKRIFIVDVSYESETQFLGLH